MASVWFIASINFFNKSQKLYGGISIILILSW